MAYLLVLSEMEEILFILMDFFCVFSAFRLDISTMVSGITK